MAESIWTRDIAGKGPKSVRTVVWTGILVGAIYCLLGGFLLISPPAEQDASPSRSGFAAGLVGVGILGVVAGILVKRRVRAGIPIGWVFFLIITAIAAIGALMSLASGNPTKAIGPIGFTVIGILAIRGLCSAELAEYMLSPTPAAPATVGDEESEPSGTNS